VAGRAPVDVERIAALDGLRGWAALSVIVFHLTWELFGGVFPIYRNQWLSIFGNGAFAVAVFFAISGYVLTIGRWGRTDNPPLPLTLVRRYLRLELPVLATVLITLIVMSLDLTPTAAAAVIDNSPQWMGSFANFAPDPLHALFYSLVRVFWIARTENYVPFLWTMAVEFWGSLIVLTLSHWSPRWGVSYLVLIAVTVAICLNFPQALPIFPQALPFPLGALVALGQRDGWLFTRPPSPLESFVATAGLVLILLCVGAFQVTFSWQVPSLVAGFLVFVCVLRSLPARALLSTRLSQVLGRLSFPLYLVQYPVIITLGAGAVVAIHGVGMLTPWTALAVIAVLFVVIFAAAAAFLPVEIFTLKLVRRIGRKPIAATAGTVPSSPLP
jgi:peptidoglycan/LPS O-acetylase OafA/YrhL